MSLHPDLRADAERILTEAHKPWRNVWAVEPDHILYENKMGKARTLWLRRSKDGVLKVRMVEGFEAHTPSGFEARRPAHWSNP